VGVERLLRNRRERLGVTCGVVDTVDLLCNPVLDQVDLPGDVGVLGYAGPIDRGVTVLAGGAASAGVHLVPVRRTNRLRRHANVQLSCRGCAAAPARRW